MSPRGDERLRAAERRALASGSVADEAALLTERLRAGSLTRERLELAAYCGHEAARVAVDPVTGCFGPRGERLWGALALEPWVRGLSRWGPEDLRDWRAP